MSARRSEPRKHKCRNGRFFTIGDHGAELFNYKRGDIIFNAAQTKEIFEKGRAISNGGRGRALVTGTAFDNGWGGFNPFDPSASTSTSTSTSSTSSTSSTTSKTSSSSKSNDSDTSLFDWIEVAIERIELLISNLGRTAESTFKRLSTRLSASYNEISKVSGEIIMQQQAYSRYIQQAESIALDDTLKRAVQSGTIDIREYNSETQEIINSYKEWYDKAMAAADAVDELNETLGELYKSRFDAVQTDFENQLALIEHLTSTYNTGLSMIEESGYMGGMKFYQEMQKIEQQNIATRQRELADLTQAMSDAINSGAVEMYSDAWHEMQQNINAVKEAIQESELAVIKYGNAIRQIEWDTFDYAQERIGNLTSESEFLINLLESSDLFDDKGRLTGTGQAQMGLHAVNYDVYMAQADQYAAEIKKINAEIAKDPNNKTLIARRQELLKLQQDSILAAESEKQAVADLVEKGIKLELDALKELINAYEDSLDSQKDLYDYQKRISKQTAEIASLQKQLAAYQGDTSEENKARIQKLNVSLSEAMEELNETQYDQYIKDQKKLLDSLYSDYEKLLNERLDDIDKLMIDVIDATNANAATISDALNAEISVVGYTLSSEMQSIWSGGGEAATVVAQYGEAFTSQLTMVNSALSGISASVAAMVTTGNAIAESLVAKTSATTATTSSSNLPTPTTTALPASEVPQTTTAKTPDTSSTSSGSGSGKRVKVGAGTWYVRADASMAGAILGVAKEGDKFTYTGTTKNNFNGIIYKGQKAWISASGTSIIGYKKGGIIGDLQKIALRNGDDMITVNTLKKGEGILTPEQTVQFKKIAEHLPTLQGVVDTSGAWGNIRSGNGFKNGETTVGFGDINIAIDHVQDYNDFVEQLQKDDHFERMIQDMTVNRLIGGSKLSKLNHRWN